MTKHEIMIIANYAQKSSLSLEELCEICNITVDNVHEFIAYEIIRPKYSVQQSVVFDVVDLKRIKTALRLQHDLDINLAGVALALDLLDEIEELRAYTEFLERQF